MQPVARIAICVLLCLPVAAQTPGKPGTGQEAQGEASGLPNAPSSARGRKASQAATAKQQNAAQAPANTIPYEPLSNRQKFNRFIGTTVSPYTFVSAGLNATWLQINGEPYDYGGGMKGWGNRFGANLADTEVRSFFSQFFFPVFLNQDPRYFPKRQGNVFDRGWYAATRVLVVRADDGHPEFNSSYLLSVAFSRAVSTAYIPEDQRNVRNTMLSIAGAYWGDAGSYVLREFWPDIMRVFRRHAPEKVLEIEKKIPPQLMGAPPEADGSKSNCSDCNCAGQENCNCSKNGNSDCSKDKKSGSDSGQSPASKTDCAPGRQCQP
jgi:hypothetical protein